MSKPATSKRKARPSLGVVALILLALGFVYWFRNSLLSMPEGPRLYLRYEKPTRLEAVLANLQEKQVIRSVAAVRLYAWFHRLPSTVVGGTYAFRAGMTAQQIVNALEKPIRLMVRLPETNWARRSANLLERDNVASAQDYLSLVSHPQEFKKDVSFPLPSSSLEGYLYPDTYELPPLFGARRVVERQLRTFDRKIWKALNQPRDLQRVVTVASLIELEVSRDEERPIVAGVIENRLAKGMPLQIDASINYAIQKWRPLAVSDYHSVDSPYNLYLHKGLPPGPICSPSYNSVLAALHPAKHNFLYYVALPNGHSLFAQTYTEHLRNVKKRMQALKRLQK